MSSLVSTMRVGSDLLIKDSVSRKIFSWSDTADGVLIVVTVYFQSMCASGGYLADSFVNITSSCENTNPVVPADDEWIGSRHSQHTIGDSKKVLKGHWRA